MDIILRPVTDADLPRLFEQQADLQAAEMAGVPPRDEATFHAHWARIRVDDSVILRAVLAEGELAGHVVSFWRYGHHQVGYLLSRAHWGRGIATRALALFLEEAERARPLYAHVARHNTASKRVLEKCGFRGLPSEQEDELFVLE